MKWVLFTGSWRLTNREVENDVRSAVRECISHGDGIVTGGATGVDYFCMDECLKNGYMNRLRVFIPVSIDAYISDYHKNWCHEPIIEQDIVLLEKVLKNLQIENPSGLLEMKHECMDVSQAYYDLRNTEEVMFSDEVYAFQVNNSTGTQDTIDKARASGLPITVYKKYEIK